MSGLIWIVAILMLVASVAMLTLAAYDIWQSETLWRTVEMAEDVSTPGTLVQGANAERFSILSIFTPRVLIGLALGIAGLALIARERMLTPDRRPPQ